MRLAVFIGRPFESRASVSGLKRNVSHAHDLITNLSVRVYAELLFCHWMPCIMVSVYLGGFMWVCRGTLHYNFLALLCVDVAPFSFI